MRNFASAYFLFKCNYVLHVTECVFFSYFMQYIYPGNTFTTNRLKPLREIRSFVTRRKDLEYEYKYENKLNLY